MRSFFHSLPILLSLLFASFCTYGNSGSTPTTLSGDFTFQVSAGYGLIENPLEARNDIDVYVLPEFSYYGERFYMENFVLGYSLHETPNLMIDLFGYFNQDGYFFELDGIEKITLSTVLGVSPTRLPIGRVVKDMKDIERQLSYMGGLNITYRSYQFDYNFSYAKDISNVHHGIEAKFAFRHTAVWSNWMLATSAVFTHKSAQINDYYYLLREQEVPFRFSEESLGSSLTAKLELLTSYRFNEHLSGNWLLQRTWFDAKLKTSHLVEDSHYWTTFIGLTYRF